jgi:hypothetical protein
MYLDLVACGPDVNRSPSAMPMNILARIVKLDHEDCASTIRHEEGATEPGIVAK